LAASLVEETWGEVMDSRGMALELYDVLLFYSLVVPEARLELADDGTFYAHA
jgi:hypothetical protein